MDAVDPALVDQAEQTLRGAPGVLGVGQVRLRWIGHQLRAECEIVVDARDDRRSRRTRSRSPPSTPCCTPCPGCPRRWCTPTRTAPAADPHAPLAYHAPDG